MAVRFGPRDNGHKLVKIRQYLETAIDLLADKLVEDECNSLPMDGLVSLLDLSGMYNIDKFGLKMLVFALTQHVQGLNLARQFTNM